MPVYQYKGYREGGTGKGETGIIDADSPKEARLKLLGQKLFVSELTAIVDVSDETDDAKESAFKFDLRRASVQDLAVMTRQFGTLLNAGIPMIEALSAMIEQADNDYLNATLRDVRERISSGDSLAEGLRPHKKWFNDLYVSMIRAGEASGNLDTVLIRLADYLTAQARLRAKVVAAMTYPIIMVVVGIGVVSFLLAFVVPKITEVLINQQGVDSLPLPTEILLWAQGMFQNYWWVIVSAAVAAFGAYKAYVRTERGKYLRDKVMINIPVIGTLFRKQAISRFASTFSTLLESGLPVIEALHILRSVVGNEVLGEAIEDVRTKITEGADIATPMKSSKVFPPVVAYMIAIGEESGSLEDLLRRVAEAYDDEIEVSAQKITTLLEPIMIVGLAAVVGFIVLAILLPILQIANI